MLPRSLLSLSVSLMRKRRRVFFKKSAAHVFKTRGQRLQLFKLYSQIVAQRRRIKVIRQKRHRRWWVRPLLEHHEEYGAWFTTIPIMREKDPERFYRSFRMTPKAFDELLELVAPFLEKRSWRKAVCPGERLAITLRYLASGDDFESLELYFLVAYETISNIVFETTTVIWHVLEPIVFPPMTADFWLHTASQFEVMWHLPHCVGAIDGKHIRIKAPPRSGSRNCNYKKFFSIILLAVCDAKQKLIVVDVGSSGKRGDGNVYHASAFGKRLQGGQLDLPPPCSVDGCKGKLPFFFVGDAAFEGSNFMIHPYKGTYLDPELKVFNYRISRARGNVEDTFGMLGRRYNVLERPIQLSKAAAKSVVLSCCALHNLHLSDEGSVPEYRKRNSFGSYADYTRDDGTQVFGRFKNENPAREQEVLQRLRAEFALNKGGGTSSLETEETDTNDLLIDYFIEKDLPWQWKLAKLI